MAPVLGIVHIADMVHSQDGRHECGPYDDPHRMNIGKVVGASLSTSTAQLSDELWTCSRGAIVGSLIPHNLPV